MVCQELLEAFQYSESDVRSAVHLEKTATILIAWSAALRLRQNKQLEIMDLLQSIPNRTNPDINSQSENIKKAQKTIEQKTEKISKRPLSEEKNLLRTPPPKNLKNSPKYPENYLF